MLKSTVQLYQHHSASNQLDPIHYVPKRRENLRRKAADVKCHEALPHAQEGRGKIISLTLEKNHAGLQEWRYLPQC